MANLIYLLTYLDIYFNPKDNSSYHGDMYLRKCESGAYYQKIMHKKLVNRGALRTYPNRIHCSYDGGFGDTVVENTL